MEELFRFLPLLFIGLILGLTGAGGSILTLPVLVYLFNIDASTAALYSLFIVGITSSLGAFSYFKQELISMKALVDFGLPSVISVVFTKMFIVPIIPEVFFSVRGVEFKKETFLMCLLSVLMLVSSYQIIVSKKTSYKDEIPVTDNYFTLATRGVIVGGLCGLVGIGGGFLIIPALILFRNLDLKKSIGTSLTIIAFQSLAGFLSSWQSYSIINWTFILQISVVTMLGVLIGSALSKKVDGKKLKIIFGWFIGFAAFYIIVYETILR